jgi:hypothetical protein
VICKITLHNCYFIQSEPNFLTGLREVLLHTTIGLGGCFVLSSPTKSIRQYMTNLFPPTLNSLGSVSVFFLYCCINIVLGAASVLLIPWKTCGMPRSIIRFVEQFLCLYSLKDQNNMFSLWTTKQIAITTKYTSWKAEGLL